MASRQALTQSLLDRLLDYDPGVEKDPPVSPVQATRELLLNVVKFQVKVLKLLDSFFNGVRFF